MEDLGATMLRTGWLVMVSIWSRMCKMPFGHEMYSALDDLSGTWHQGQNENRSKNPGAT